MEKTVAIVNQSLNTPVSVQNIDFSLLENWPNAAIILKGVKTEKQDGFQQSFIQADEILLSVDLLSVLSNRYTINEILLRKADIHLEINGDKENNYTILKKRDTEGKSDKNIDIKKITMIECNLWYTDASKKDLIETSFFLEQVVSPSQFSKEQLDLKPKGKVVWQSFSLKDISLPKPLPLQLDLDLSHLLQEKQMTVKKGSMLHKDLNISALAGEISLQGQTTIDLYLNTSAFDIDKLVEILPQKYSNSLEAYHLSGEATTALHIIGPLSDPLQQKLDMNFSIAGLSGEYNPKQLSFDQHQLQGSLTKGRGESYENALLKNIIGTGSVLNSPIHYNFDFLSANGKTLSGNLKGSTTGEDIERIYTELPVKNLQGGLNFSFHIQRIKGLYEADGEVELTNGSFETAHLKEKVERLNTSFLFNNSEIAFQQLTGQIGASDFSFQGIVINPTNLAKENAPYFIDGTLVSNQFLIDQLMGITYDQEQGKETNQQVKDYSIPEAINIKLAVDIGDIRYKRFRASNLQTNLRVQAGRITSETFHFQSIGGSVNGAFTAFPEKGFIKTIVQGELQNLASDSIFYVFENFDQDFIENKHLKGEISASVSSNLYLTKNLTPIPSTLISTIDATITNGKLVDFQPMYRLSKFVDEEQLAELSFSKLSNKITIKDSKILIPEMLIESNVSNIELSGWHTLDQKLEYHLKVPLHKKYKKDKDERFGEIADPDKNISNLFLKITGTTDDYNISYDRKAVLNKVKNDIKKEGKELIKIFQNKGKKKQETTTLDEEDFFDFSDTEPDSTSFQKKQ